MGESYARGPAEGPSLAWVKGEGKGKGVFLEEVASGLF